MIISRAIFGAIEERLKKIGGTYNPQTKRQKKTKEQSEYIPKVVIIWH